MKKIINKLISVLLSVILLFQFTITASANQKSNTVVSDCREESYTYYDEYGQEIHYELLVNDQFSMAKVYIDGILTQKTILDIQTTEAYTEALVRDESEDQMKSCTIDDGDFKRTTIFISEYELDDRDNLDIDPNVEINESLVNQFNTNDFTNEDFTLELNTDIEKNFIQTNSPAPIRAMASNYNYIYGGEPATSNNNLSSSPYGDSGFYYIGSYNWSLYPSNTATLYRSLSKDYAGYTAYKTWTIHDTASTVYTYASLLSANLPAIFISLVVFGYQQYVAYSQTTEVKTYNFTYNYKVRTSSGGNNVYLTPWQKSTYWWVHNQATGKGAYELKSNNGGSISGPPEWCQEAINNYNIYRFTDTYNHWSKDHAVWAYNKGYMSGTSTYHFSPNSVTSRAMAVTVLYNMAGKPNTSILNPFTDVPNDKWYTKAVIWANNNGIASGVSSNRFAPNDNITREQLAVMLYHFAAYKWKNTSANYSLSRFPDSGSVSSWAKTPMQWAVGKGIIHGDGGYLKPKNNATRAELAAMIRNFENY